MFHILTLTYLEPLEVIDRTRPAHLDWLTAEVAAGRVVLAGRQESQTGGVLVTGDISVEEAQDVIDRDPYQQAGLVRYDRLSFTAGFRAPGLSDR
ncbi:GTP cyclohydrolase [Mycobacterium sp. PS03-16]|uniref:YciI family protein n=1 Tax=Mycobacterium sp. PS03-16 TaxID=2559611 RepID=UPI0010746BB1|nr:YciI family protein [Mycobacterium sp. PS03-16]TFV60332.1 GTP cyclohydrolase [Mycobacterium sp. PS03-16]